MDRGCPNCKRVTGSNGESGPRTASKWYRACLGLCTEGTLQGQLDERVPSDVASVPVTIKTALLTASVSRQAGGLFWAMRALSDSLVEIGCEIRVFGGADAYSREDSKEWGSTPVSVLSTAGPRAFGYQRGLIRALRTYQPDILHVHGLWMYPSLVAAGSARKLPRVVSPHGMLDPWAVRNSAFRKRIAAFLYESANLRRAACIHALCGAEHKAIRAYGLKNPVAVIPNGVDLPDSENDHSPPRWAAGLPAGAKVLFFLSRLHPKKGLLSLLSGWAKARKVLPAADGWQLVIAGWEQGGHRAELKRKVVALGCEGSVHLVGPQFGDDKAASLRRADAFVLPSLSEGLPMAILEAWAYGLPVVMTPQCNIPEGFSSGAAIRIEPEETSIANGLHTLFTMHEGRRKQMGALGRRLVEEKFSWPRIGESMRDVYRWMLGEGPRPSCIVDD